MDQHPIQGGVKVIVSSASCYRKQDKLQHDEPLGSYADFTLDCTYVVSSNVAGNRMILLIKMFWIIACSDDMNLAKNTTRLSLANMFQQIRCELNLQ